MNGTTVGINLLACNLADCPAHYRAMDYALRSLLDSDLREFDWRLQVVDNGSTCRETQERLDLLGQQEPRASVHWAGENLGIPRGRNLGYQMLRAEFEPEFVVEVHTDHLFPERWLGSIVGHMQAPVWERAGMVGAALTTGGGQWRSPQLMLDYSHPYAQIRAALEAHAKTWYRANDLRPGLAHPVVIRWAMVEALGERDGSGFCVYDPLLPGKQNFEDTELVFRAWKAGWKVLIDFSTMVYHAYHQGRLAISTGSDGVPYHDPDPNGSQDHLSGYDQNAVYCQRKHGHDFIPFATATLGQWMERAYVR